MTAFDSMETDRRLRKLRIIKRCFAPIRAGLIASFCALASGTHFGSRPLAINVGLILIFAYITMERLTIPARIEGWQSDRRTKGALALAFFCSLLVSFADRGRGPLLPLSQSLELPLLGTGVALIAVGGAIRQWSIRTLGPYFTDRARVIDDHQLVRSGPYRLVRHPSYSGLMLVFLGFPLLLGSIVGMTLCVLLCPLAIYLRIRVEEDLLSGYFGVAWEDYAAETPRLVPRLGGG